MACVFFPMAEEVRSAVEGEVRIAGGRVSECLLENDSLFLRSVLPRQCEVRPKDVLDAGVAVMVHGPRILVHPYTYRQVCRNGAIMARIIDTRQIDRVPEPSGGADDELLDRVRQTVQSCTSDEVFSKVSAKLLSAGETPADLALHLLPMLSRLPKRHSSEIIAHILHWFDRDGDRTVFGLMNAVTRVARDERRPRARWRLEELGGGILAHVRPSPKRGGAAAATNQQASKAEFAMR